MIGVWSRFVSEVCCRCRQRRLKLSGSLNRSKADRFGLQRFY